jgi:chromosome segregation ATPase
MKNKQDTQISQINTLNKDRLKSDQQIEKLEKQLNLSAEENKVLSKRIEKQKEEIERMNEYISQLEQEQSTSAKSSQPSESTKELQFKIDHLEKELSHKDAKYIDLMEKLKQAQDAFKAFSVEKEAELLAYISKEKHKAELLVLQQANNELVQQIKILTQTIEKSKLEDQKMKKLLNSSNSSPTHEQLLIIKEFNDISKRVMEYDDDDRLKSKRITVFEVIDRVLKEYDTLLSNYQFLEKDLIQAKVKHAEAEELKERLVTKLETLLENKDPIMTEKSITISEADMSFESKKLNSSVSSGFFAKASNLFSSATSMYSNKFGSGSKHE